MYQVNETVLCGTHGVCKIKELTVRTIGKECVEYYILNPIGDSYMLIYIPTQNEELTSKMRRLLSVEEIDALIKSIPDKNIEWIEDGKIRREQYRQILLRGDCGDVAALIKTLRSQQAVIWGKQKSKQLAAEDKEILKIAEKLLCEEISYVTKMKYEQVLSFVFGHTEDKK
ncbi:MAG: CarD family transcriptional regulator [Clostridiales bacterium]|jgi:CarD family transcriptional regulator|nr:CarD family transcriptional regulator [Clostridiales bacterium]